VIGVVLIVVSVVGVVALVRSSGSSVVVLAARNTITPGTRVSVSELVPTSIRPGTERLYLRASQVPTGGLIVTRTVSAGELVPVSAVGSDSGASRTSVVVSTGTPLAQSIAPGARVDVWAAVPVEESVSASGKFAAPRVIASKAIVVRLVTPKGFIDTGTGSSVELLVPRASTARLLEDIANGAAISVLPVDRPLGQ
jgi:hypothetical protein